jgi:cell filamentation protein
LSDYFYDDEYDTTYCYPSSSILKNKLNIKDADSLLEAERSITALRILELKQTPPDGKLNFVFFKHLHFYIFQDIYEWAGKVRTVNISKGSQFCMFQFIDDQANDLFHKLEKENYIVDAESIAERLSLVDFAIEIVKYLLGDEKADELKAGILYKG